MIAGRYELVRPLAQGGMCTVWEGRDASTAARVAVKLIEPAVENADVRQRFLAEARASALLASEHVVRVYDYGVTPEGVHYIVMELLAGESLEQRLARVGRLGLLGTAHVVSDVCRALREAHDRGIVHRDLKPQNIFLVRGPDGEMAKVIDFGLAKVRHPDAAPLSGTRTGTILGTPLYMSPEQGRALKSVDHRTDLWSLGVIAFECVTGRVPFEARSFADLLVRAATSPTPKASALESTAPPAFDEWLVRALNPDPAGRFASAAELAEALMRVARDAARFGAAATQPMRAK